MNLTSFTANFRFDKIFVPLIGTPPSADVCCGLSLISRKEKCLREKLAI